MTDENQSTKKTCFSVLKELTKARRSPGTALIKSFSTYTNTFETAIDLTAESDVSTTKKLPNTESDVSKAKRKHRLSESDKVTNEDSVRSKKDVGHPKKPRNNSLSPNVSNSRAELLKKLNKTPTPTKETKEFFKAVPRLENSDDDFVCPPSKKVKTTIGRQVLKESYFPYDGKKIQPRIKTYKFYEYLQKLSKEQRNVVNDIGFGTILELKINQIPTSLGYWLVRNYNHETSVLDIGVERIHITAELVHKLLGIPMGCINVTEMQRACASNLVVNEWNKQFETGSHIVSPSAFLEYIGGLEDSGRVFILNFLVAFTTMLGEVTSNNAVNRKFLTCVSDISRVKDMNWCSYLISLMKRPKQKWDVNKEYNGSMLVHVLALANFHLDKVKNADKLPHPVTRFCFGDLDHLDLVESQRISYGAMQTNILRNKTKVGCGDKKGLNAIKKKLDTKTSAKKQLQIPDLINTKIVEDKCDRVVEDDKIVDTNKTFSVMDIGCETSKKTEITAVVNSEAEFISTKDEKTHVLTTGYDEEQRDEEIDIARFDTQYQVNEDDVKFAAKRLYELIQDFENNISDIKLILEAAKEDFPNNPIIEEVENMWKYVQGKYFVGENMKDVGGKKKEDGCFSPEILSPKTIEELDKAMEYTESKYKTPVNKTLVFGVPTFELDSSSSKDKSGILSDMIVKNYVISGDKVNAKDDTKVDHERPKRAKTFGEAMCSPYVQRVVQLKTPYLKPETLVADMIFGATGGSWEVVFQSSMGFSLGNVVMETMRPRVYIHVSAVRAWSEILNREEKLRQKGTTHRLFCSTVMLFPTHYSLDKETQLQQFTSNMQSILMQQELTSIKGLDLVFIPIMYSPRKHYYIMVFHLNTGRIELLDNIKCEATFNELYNNWPFIMQSTFAEYLRLEKHPRASKIAKASIVICDMPWRTINNFVDCGVFAMRHMETYKGSSMKEWNAVCNLSKESEENGLKQKMELNELRRKYVAKILLSDVNLVKDKVLKRALLFDALPLEEKININNNAMERIKQRVAGEID